MIHDGVNVLGSAILGILALVAVSCAAPAPPERATAPVIPERALATLEQAARSGGLAPERYGDTVILTTPGARDATPDETLAFLEAHRKTPDAPFSSGIDSSGFGACLWDRTLVLPGGCAHLDAWEDSPSLGALPAAIVRIAAAADRDGPRFHVAVTVMALPRPRCGPRDGCGPEPYDRAHAHAPRPPGKRHRVARSADGGRCAYDGECRFVCGCERYESRARACDAVYYEELRGAWCGCVDGACAWFR
jgi:hypothetical protein